MSVSIVHNWMVVLLLYAVGITMWYDWIENFSKMCEI